VKSEINSKMPRVAAVVFIPIFVVGLILAPFAIYNALPEWGTKYAGPRVKSEFGNIRPGISLDEVYLKLGRPYYAAVINNESHAFVEYDYDVSIEHLRSRMQAGDISLGLHYSRNNGRTGWYVECRIEVRGGKVVEIRRDELD
jgi:hypothetical protein